MTRVSPFEIAVLVAAVLTVSCGEKSGSSGSAASSSSTATETSTQTATETSTQTATETSTGTSAGVDSGESDGVTLAGVWKSECLDFGGGIWAIVTLTNTDTESRYDLTVYVTSSCVVPIRKETSLRTYAIVGDVDGIEGAKKVNFTYSTSSTIMLADDAVTEANANQLYGYSDWAKGSAKDTTGRPEESGSDPQYAAGDVSFLIVKIEADTYHSADTTTGDGDSEATRPTAIGNVTLKRQ
jgi:hypothetical protein